MLTRIWRKRMGFPGWLTAILLILLPNVASANSIEKCNFILAQAGSKGSWGGLPWLVGGGLTVLIILIGIKNAKRSHLD